MLGGDVPEPFDNLAADGLGEPGVEGAAHAAGLHRPQVLNVDNRVPAVMAWSAAHRAADQARASLRCDRRSATRLASVWRTSAFAAPGWLARPPSSLPPPPPSSGPERGDGPVRVQAARPGAQQGVQSPVDSQGDGVPGPLRLRNRLGERDVGQHPASSGPHCGQVQHGTRGNRGRQDQANRDPRPVVVAPRVGPDGKLEPQQRRRGRLVPVEGGLLPVACRQDEHPGHPRRCLHLGHVRRSRPRSRR